MILRELIIGATGYIGRALRAHLPDADIAVRHTELLTGLARGLLYPFDMLRPIPFADADVVYLCAGINGNLNCSMDPRTSYKVNVDGTIWVAEWCRDHGVFLVWISSTTVMWLNEHYGQQKRIAETYLRAMPNVGIVRAGRVLDSNVDDLCRIMIDLGRNKKRELVLWQEDESPYSHKG